MTVRLNCVDLNTDKYNQNTTSKNNAASFKGMSKPFEYCTAIDYMSASIIDSNKELRNALGRKATWASKIRESVLALFDKNLVFGEIPVVDITKTKFAKDISEEIRQTIKKSIDKTRESTMRVWQEIITNNKKIKYYEKSSEHEEKGNKRKLIYNAENDDNNFFNVIPNEPSLQFVIWKSFLSDLADNNRHIPPPFNPEAMKNTVIHFLKLPKEKYVAKAAGISKFREKYQEELINNAINCIYNNKNGEFSEFKMYNIDGELINKNKIKSLEELKKLDYLWIEIPRKQNDKKHTQRNVAVLEQLSHNNWCTKSRSDMAANYLKYGNFFILLKRNYEKDCMTPEIGINTVSKKYRKQERHERNLEKNSHYTEFIRIQGALNNNIVPNEYKDAIIKLAQKNDFRFCTKKSDGEGEFAAIQMGLKQ